ncbi:hypothetical protein LR010_01030 [Candidatus Gracilibacteria bacterium]|nr:hypothetical protein [Candidatus Gracilibacteria bacterium]
MLDQKNDNNDESIFKGTMIWDALGIGRKKGGSDEFVDSLGSGCEYIGKKVLLFTGSVSNKIRRSLEKVELPLFLKGDEEQDEVKKMVNNLSRGLERIKTSDIKTYIHGNLTLQQKLDVIKREFNESKDEFSYEVVPLKGGKEFEVRFRKNETWHNQYPALTPFTIREIDLLVSIEIAESVGLHKRDRVLGYEIISGKYYLMYESLDKGGELLPGSRQQSKEFKGNILDRLNASSDTDASEGLLGKIGLGIEVLDTCCGTHDVVLTNIDGRRVSSREIYNLDEITLIESIHIGIQERLIGVRDSITQGICALPNNVLGIGLENQEVVEPDFNDVIIWMLQNKGSLDKNYTANTGLKGKINKLCNLVEGNLSVSYDGNINEVFSIDGNSVCITIDGEEGDSIEEITFSNVEISNLNNLYGELHR